VSLIPIRGPRRQRPTLVSLAQDDASHTTAVLLGRILYRADLLARLPAVAHLRDASDAELALAAYRQLGRRGLELLEGEFSLVIHDGLQGRLWAQRDPFGCWPLFWSVAGNSVAAGTSLEALAQRQPGRAFNLDFLADFLVQPLPGSELPCEQTAFKGVQRVRPGTIVELDGAGQAVRHAYWDWAARIGRTETTSLDEAGQRCAGLLRGAVRERVVPWAGVAAHQSGGAASAAVVCLARDELAAQGARSPLFTLAGAEALDYDWFREEIPAHDEPCSLLPSLPSRRLVIEAADRLGAAVTLSGLGGDEIVTCPPYHLADLVRGGRWLAALAEAQQWAAADNEGTWSVLRRFGVEPLRPGFVGVPPWVRRDFSRRQHLRQRSQDCARRMFARPAARSWDLFVLESTSGDWGRWHLAAPRGLNLSHPFRDPRLVAFALGLPRHLRGRPILEAALAGVTKWEGEAPAEPGAKRFGRSLALPGGAHGNGAVGLRRNLTMLEEMVRQAALRELGLFDHEELVRCLHRAAGEGGDRSRLEQMDRSLALIAWFDQVVGCRPASPAGQPCEWTINEIEPAKVVNHVPDGRGPGGDDVRAGGRPRRVGGGSDRALAERAALTSAGQEGLSGCPRLSG
jgi:asparagine synthase (glutamine-hydrolysing)